LEKDILTNSGATSGSIADYLNLDGSLAEVRRRAADEAEKHAILKAWQNSSRDLEKAAAELGISSKTLAAKLKDWKL
jgi:transcriptional regulator with PAS, ATPase and Fis domain